MMRVCGLWIVRRECMRSIGDRQGAGSINDNHSLDGAAQTLEPQTDIKTRAERYEIRR